MCDSCRRKRAQLQADQAGSDRSTLINRGNGADRRAANLRAGGSLHARSFGLRKARSGTTISQPAKVTVKKSISKDCVSDMENTVGQSMPDFSGAATENGGVLHQNGGVDMASVMEDFKKKSGLPQRSAVAQVTNSSQLLSNSSSSTSSSRVAKTSLTSTSTSSSSSQRVHHVTSSSSSELKASSMKSDIAELKSSIHEMKNLQSLSNRIRSSVENLVDGTSGTDDVVNEPLVTFPDTPDAVVVPQPVLSAANVGGNSVSSSDTVKFEQKRMTSASKTKVVTDSYRAEQATAESAELRRLRAGDMSYQEQSAAAAVRSRLKVDGVTTEHSAAATQEQRSLKTSDATHTDARSAAAQSVRVRGDAFSAEQTQVSQMAQQRTVHREQQATFTTKSSLVSSQMSSQLMNGNLQCEDILRLNFDDLEQLCSNSNQQEVDKAISKYSTCLDNFVKTLRRNDSFSVQAPHVLNRINDIIRKAWAVPTHGHELGYSLCNTLRNCGGLDLLMSNCMTDDRDLQFSSAQLLEQCLTTENRAHVVEKGLDKVVNVACACTRNINSVDHARVGTGILEHLFKHSESACSDVIKLGGLDAVLFECRKNDIETLRHCAGALANLSLYGGAENQVTMINQQVPMWLFPLAFHNDDNIKYYACLAIAVLVANKEIEAAVIQSGTLELVEPFVMSHNPSEFAKSNLAHAHGQSKNWLQRLVPVLSSKREEARNLAAFHFCMEAGIKKQQGNTEIFHEIGAIEPLKKVASCPNAVASKYAAQALRLIGEEVPHKLSQQVPLWSSEDVKEWVNQIGFTEYANNFVESRVDGDLLLQLTEENLMEDIGLTNGIRRRRFTRELQNLKKMADYSSRDKGCLNGLLQQIAPEFSIYTYSMLNAGVDKDSICNLTDEQLIKECGITNSIHRLRILDAIRSMETNMSTYFSEEVHGKPLDVFVSYRRSNGSQLASLLKVHLQLRGFKVFIDVERLEAGKFDNNLLQSIRQAKHFLLVLTPKALERCLGDSDCKDWVHREIVAALQSQCNIIPIIDNFQWPEPEDLPEDMRAVCHFNGVRWIHDYQDACVDKLERFLRGELNMRPDVSLMGGRGTSVSLSGKGDATPGTPASCGLTRQAPNYQRMHSNDSSSGKGSDKDVNGNSGGRE